MHREHLPPIVNGEFASRKEENAAISEDEELADEDFIFARCCIEDRPPRGPVIVEEAVSGREPNMLILVDVGMFWDAVRVSNCCLVEGGPALAIVKPYPLKAPDKLGATRTKCCKIMQLSTDE